MKSLKAPLITVFLIFGTVLVLISGCINSDDDEEQEVSIKVSGSTTVLPIMIEAKDAYMSEHDNLVIHIKEPPGGSSVGVEEAATGKADLGMASRELKPEEVQQWPDLQTIPIGSDGVAIVTNPDNPISDLTMDELQDIYAGEITNWVDVGGPDENITLVGRDDKSGTRATFDDSVMTDKELNDSMIKMGSNGAVKTYVSENQYSIGYIGLGYLDSQVNPVDINEVSPQTSTVQDGTYPITRNLNLVVMGDPDGEVAEFIDFIKSSTGQQIVQDQGFVPLK